MTEIRRPITAHYEVDPRVGLDPDAIRAGDKYFALARRAGKPRKFCVAGAYREIERVLREKRIAALAADVGAPVVPRVNVEFREAAE